MTTPEFSPGPWWPGHLGEEGRCQCKGIVDEAHAGGIASVCVDNGIKSIAEGGNDCPPREQAIANMHLIAAAPDLYAALAGLVERCEFRPKRSRGRLGAPMLSQQGEAERAALVAAHAAMARALNLDDAQNAVRVARKAVGDDE